MSIYFSSSFPPINPLIQVKTSSKTDNFSSYYYQSDKTRFKNNLYNKQTFFFQHFQQGFQQYGGKLLLHRLRRLQDTK